jgi:ribosomal protein L40E
MRDKSDGKNKNIFIGDKFQRYYEDVMSTIKYLDTDHEDAKKPIKIPKITRKEQIYWICERCGLSNPYFLSKCKECSFKRPGSLYESYEQVSLSKKTITTKPSISQVITDDWQTIEVIADKMGINDINELKSLKKKLEYLAEVNYLIPNSTRTMFKFNTFKM